MLDKVRRMELFMVVVAKVCRMELAIVVVVK